jgi:hypothetical protein
LLGKQTGWPKGQMLKSSLDLCHTMGIVISSVQVSLSSFDTFGIIWWSFQIEFHFLLLIIGIFIAEEYSCLEGDHLKSSKKITFSQYPYEHYRSSQCSYYYSSSKSSITKVVTSAKCPNCRKFYSNRKAASKRPHLSLTNQPSEKVKHISNEEIIFLEEKVSIFVSLIQYSLDYCQ